MNMKDCGLSIQINEESFTVKGTTIEDHGDSNAKEGFCNAIRVAKISGTVKDKVFLAENFKLQKN